MTAHVLDDGFSGCACGHKESFISNTNSIYQNAVSARGDSDFLPVRMLNEYAYCPRLFHLMHVEGLWADNAFTEDGKAEHDAGRIIASLGKTYEPPTRALVV